MPTKASLMKEIEGIKERLSLIMDSLPIIAYTCEPFGDFDTTYISENLKKITGYSPEYFISYTPLWSENIHPDDIVRIFKNLPKIFEEGYIEHEYRWRIADGSYICIKDRLHLIKSPDGKPSKILGIWEIVADQKKVEDTQRDAERISVIIETATNMGRSLSNSLRSIANSVYLMKENLRNMQVSPEKNELEKLFGALEIDTNHINKLIFSLRDFAKPLKPEPIDIYLQELVNNTLSIVGIPENVKVAVNVKEGFQMKADPAMMEHALISLVTNAIQAMPKGGILTIEAAKSDNESSLSIHDTGIGITEEKMNIILHPYQATKHKERGLGLPICERMVKAHNGEIIVKTKVGLGTTFIIKIPYE